MRTCKYCKCTDERACSGGCCWVHPKLDICSSCLSEANDREMIALLVHSASNQATYLRLDLTPSLLLQLSGMLQLCLRHPQLPPTSIQAAKTLCDVFRTAAELQEDYVVLEAMRRSENPAFDNPTFC